MEERMIDILVDRWRECTVKSQTVGKSWGRDLFCTPLLRITFPLSRTLSVYMYSSFSLCLASLAVLWFVLFSSIAICCYSQRLAGYKDGQCVYTSLECGIPSTLLLLSHAEGVWEVFEKMKRTETQRAGMHMVPVHIHRTILLSSCW